MYYIIDTTTSSYQQYDAIIIGAGWSGIRAAQALVESDITNFIVLESANYIGGRSRTKNADGSTNNPALIGDTTNIPYEMGSEWLYANSDQETVLKNEGYLPKELWDGDKDSVNLFPATWYQQTRDVDSGEVITKKLDDSDEWMDEIWYVMFPQPWLILMTSFFIRSCCCCYSNDTYLMHSVSFFLLLLYTH